MSITALPVTAWAETPAESAVTGAETATDHVDENAVDEKQAAGTEQRLNYMYIDQPYLETPNTQKVVVSWGDGSEGIEQMTATVQGPVGEEVWTAVQESDGIYLFERAYTEQERGVYSVTELHVTIAGNVYDYSLADLGIEALFGVDEKYEGIEELQPVSEEEVSADIAAYNIDESGNVTEQSSIEEAIVQAEQEIPAMMSDDGVQTQSSNIVVALDPGHDSTHAGASANGVREEVLTLKIAQYCKAELEEYAGVSVYMTRTTADCPHPGGSSAHDIDQRVADAAAAGASVYVSFHLNSSLSSAAKGAEIIIPNTNWKPQVGNDGKKLATLIESELVGLGLEERKIYSKNTTVNERYEDGSLSDYFTVQISAKEHGIPGIIVEHAFVTNTSDVNNFLNNEAGLKKLGVADATGIAKYFGLSKGQWYKDSTGWWYASGTSYLKNQWAQISGSWYYFGGTDDGAMKNGWQKVGSTWYYLGSADGGYMQTGWKKLGTNWYYFGESNDGAMRTGFAKVGGNYYYFGGTDDGAMKTGWQKIDGTWYFFNDDGMYDSTKKYDEIPGINDDKINGSAGTNNSNTNSNVVEGTYLIEGDTEVTVDQMVAYFEASKKAYPEDVMRKGGAATIRDFCQIYYEEAVAEGIKAEVAFVQAMKETGWLQFTGVVKAEQYNFAGMGATGNGVSGESFKDVREGVRAQIQHLKAYGSTKSLNQTCVDNRFKYVERGSAIYVEWLSIPNNPKKKGWAAANGYGVDIVKMIQKMKTM